MNALYINGLSAIVPLAEVLDGLAARAELELDQPEEVVVGVEGVADPAQVVDARATLAGVADHRPLDGVAGTHVAPVGRSSRRRSTRRAARPDGRGRGEHLALVAGEVEPDAVGVLGAHGLPHPLEVRQRPRA